jgi:hypothetical protein
MRLSSDDSEKTINTIIAATDPRILELNVEYVSAI